MKKKILTIIFALLASTLFVLPAYAQNDDELKLSMSRDFGYSSGTGDIQGTFSMKVSGPESLLRVEFYIDEILIGADNEPPFKIQFITDDYPLGLHTLYAVGYLSNGTELKTREVNANFVTADEGWQAAIKIIAPVLILVLLAAVISSVIPVLNRRGKKNQILPPGERSYGVVGGTICPRCNHPFGMNFFSPNMLVGKLVCCDQCGKWFIGKRATPDALHAAEEAEWSQANNKMPSSKISEDEKLKDKVDASKYMD